MPSILTPKNTTIADAGRHASVLFLFDKYTASPPSEERGAETQPHISMVRVNLGFGWAVGGVGCCSGELDEKMRGRAWQLGGWCGIPGWM